MLFYCCVAHPTLIFRVSSVIEDLYYEEGAGKIEDYKLWFNIIQKEKYKFFNVGSVILKYRKHNFNASLGETIIEETKLKQ